MSEARKHKAGGQVPKPANLPRTSTADGLTCSEGQVEDLLSEGESTETERKVPGRSSKQAVRKIPARA